MSTRAHYIVDELKGARLGQNPICNINREEGDHLGEHVTCLLPAISPPRGIAQEEKIITYSKSICFYFQNKKKKTLGM